ncbi:ubiquitin-conjugating enzyme/RWD-like protein, partial [Zychaea mexicana]|uniref:ubiquitin-conjugating enzyme/RWD-like protein n=1 Tax=Zychaea mexicana TaxID=64656 RepID=UPI0022FDF972
RKIADLERDPRPGIICHPVDDDDITHLEAFIKGPPDSPYEKGNFKLDIKVPDDYPFSPPQMRFLTRVYHPNIDDGGRICADILKKGEHGSWRPSLNISTTLISLSGLLASPNPDDPLDAEIAREYQLDHALFLSKAREYTFKYATGKQADEDSVRFFYLICSDTSCQ